MRPPLEGVVLLTGASSGIGRALAKEIAPRAQVLVLVARRKNELESLATELRTQHPRLTILVKLCDLLVQEQIDTMLDAVQQEVGIVDILINSAGFGDLGLFEFTDWQKTRRMIDLNVTALTYLTHRLVGPMVQQQRGGILNISSGFGLSFFPGFATYAATKHYVTAFTESLRLDLEGTGVVVTQSCPGPVATEFNDHLGNFTGYAIPSFLEISAEQCAHETLQAFDLGRAMIIPGVVAWLLISLGNMAPRFLQRIVLAQLVSHLRQLQIQSREMLP